MTTTPLLSFLFALTLGAVAGTQTAGGAATNARREKAPRTLLPVPAAIEAESDIVYKAVGGEKLALDLYRVKGRKYDQAPLVIWIHGGGYVKGSKEGAVKHNAELMVPLLMEHGYLVASLDYRFVALKGPKLIDCMADCLDGVRFLAKNSARFGLDPTRMVSIGSSAGGGLALMMALAQDGIRSISLLIALMLVSHGATAQTALKSPEHAQSGKPAETTARASEFYSVDLRDEDMRIPPTLKPLFDQFMRDTYCML